MEHADQPPWLHVFVKWAELAFLVFFSVEVAIKMFGLGFRRVFRSAFSVLDLVVIVGSFIELGVVQSTQNPIGLSALRALRRQLKFPVLSLVGSIKSILSLLLLLFGGKMIYDPLPTYANVLGYLNVFFTFVFTLENLFKLVGLEPLRNTKDPWNA